MTALLLDPKDPLKTRHDQVLPSSRGDLSGGIRDFLVGYCT